MNFGQVILKLGLDLMHGFQRRTRQFELAARFQADIGAVLRQADDLALFHEQDVRSEGAGEIHLVRGHDHGHAAVRKIADDREHFTDKFRVEG